MARDGKGQEGKEEKGEGKEERKGKEKKGGGGRKVTIIPGL